MQKKYSFFQNSPIEIVESYLGDNDHFLKIWDLHQLGTFREVKHAATPLTHNTQKEHHFYFVR